MKNVKVSIIVPVYNAEKYLEQCMDSLISQTLEETEIILTDDGSTDSTPAILKRYKDKFPDKITVLRTENKGVSSARNTALKIAAGEYIQFVDADDYISQDMSRKLYEAAKEQECDIVICDRFDVYEKDGVTEERRGENPHKLDMTGESFTPCAGGEAYINISPYPWDKLIKRELIKDLEFPEGIRFEDLVYVYTACALAKKAVWVKEPLYYYRKNVGFLAGFSKETGDILKALQKLKDNLEQNGINGLERELEFIFIRHILLRYRVLMAPKNKGCIKEKLAFISESWDFLKEHYPCWKKNYYYNNCFKEGREMHADLFICKAMVKAAVLYYEFFK